MWSLMVLSSALVGQHTSPIQIIKTVNRKGATVSSHSCCGMWKRSNPYRIALHLLIWEALKWWMLWLAVWPGTDTGSARSQICVLEDDVCGKWWGWALLISQHGDWMNGNLWPTKQHFWEPFTTYMSNLALATTNVAKGVGIPAAHLCR